MTQDSIYRQEAIDAADRADYTGLAVEDVKKVTDEVVKELKRLPSAQTDLITKMQNGIKATDADDAYSCGMRNGMRWCISLIDGKEPMYENCPPSQPEIIRCKDCKYCDAFPEGADNDMPSKCLGIRYGGVYPDWFCEHAERRTDDY